MGRQKVVSWAGVVAALGIATGSPGCKKGDRGARRAPAAAPGAMEPDRASEMKPGGEPDENPDEMAGSMAKPGADEKRAVEEPRRIVREKMKLGDLKKTAGWMGFGEGRPRESPGLGGRRARTYQPPSGRVLMGRVTSSGGGFSVAQVRRYVRRHREEIERCYQARGLTSNPKLAGEVTIALIVNASGEVRFVSVRRTTLNHSATQACIRSAARRWRFPKTNGSIVNATVEYKLKP